MKLLHITLIACASFYLASCAATAQTTSKTDDIYYSSGDGKQADTTIPAVEQTTSISEASKTIPSEESYQYSETPSSGDDYRVYSDDFSSEKYYDEQGNEYIVNNYYYEDNYYDDYYYSNNIRRYYDPYYGYSYWSPWYSSWYYDPYSYWYSPGFHISIGWGCGPSWYNPYYSYYYPWYAYNPWYNPYYGYGGYWNGYNYGYWNGYNNGYYGGYYNDYYGYNGYNNGYYGNDYGDNGYYYGPRDETASNTDNGSNGSTYYGGTIDRLNDDRDNVFGQNSPQSSVFDTNGKGDGDVEKGPEVIVAENKPTTEAGKVRVVKYYSADSKPAVTDNAASAPSRGNTPSSVHYSTQDVKNNDVPVNRNDHMYSPSSIENKNEMEMKQDMPVRENKNYQSLPSKGDNRYQSAPSKTSDRNSQPERNYNSNNTSSNTNRTYNNNSSSSRSSGSYSSGSSSRSGSSGSSSSKKRSGGN